MPSIVTVLIWFTALSSGLIAGVYFAFSGFIMKALSKLDIAQSIAAMNAINETILRSLFIPLFFGSSIISLLLVIISIIYWNETDATLVLITGAIYFIGMFVCTVLFNLPLNTALEVLRPDNNNKQSWSHYLKIWTAWNHLRTISSLVTCILCIYLLTP